MSRFKSIDKDTYFYRGLIIKGYTYSKSDFHNRETGNKLHFGGQKLRTGIILDIYDDNYFLVQFQNSSAKSRNKFDQEKNVNNIRVTNYKNALNIIGTNSFCMIIKKDKISHYYTKFTKLDLLNWSKIYDKLSIKRKTAISKFKKKLFLDWNADQIKNELENNQFLSIENQFTNENALKKLEIIWDRHNKNNPVSNENKKILETYDAINWNLVNSDERYEFYNVNNRSYRSDKTYLQIGYEVAKEYNLKLPKNKEILDKPKTYLNHQIKELEAMANKLMLNPEGIVKIKNKNQSYQDNKHEEVNENLMESNIIKKEPNNRER